MAHFRFGRCVGRLVGTLARVTLVSSNAGPLGRNTVPRPASQRASCDGFHRGSFASPRETSSFANRACSVRDTGPWSATLALARLPGYLPWRAVFCSESLLPLDGFLSPRKKFRGKAHEGRSLL